MRRALKRKGWLSCFSKDKVYNLEKSFEMEEYRKRPQVTRHDWDKQRAQIAGRRELKIKGSLRHDWEFGFYNGRPQGDLTRILAGDVVFFQCTV